MWAFYKSYMLFPLVLQFYGKLKQESLNSAPKFPYLGVFRLKFEKNKLLWHLKQPRIFQNANFCAKLKKLKFGSLLAAFGQQLKKTMFIFEISTLKFAKMQSFM